MDEQEQVWQKQRGENSRWFSRFNLYLRMGPTRSLLGAVNIEAAQKSQKKVNYVPGAWQQAFDRFQWKARAISYDAFQQKLAEERQADLDALEQAEKKRILSYQYAKMHARVEALNDMAHAIETSMKDPDSGTYNPKWMNPEKLREWRGCLDDIAKELGERIKKTELTGKGGGPLTIETFWGGGVASNEE